MIIKQAVETLKSEPPLKPFEGAALENREICEDAGEYSLQQNYPHQAIFSGVKGIYLFSIVPTKVLSKAPYLSEDLISNFTGCILEKHLTHPVKNIDFKRSAIPIYIPHRQGIPLEAWPEIKVDGNLITAIELKLLQSEAFEDDVPEGLMLLNVRNYRPDVNVVENLFSQCSDAFPYTEDKTKLLSFLSAAMKRCLKNNFGISQ